jgi:hypothetical protein
LIVGLYSLLETALFDDTVVALAHNGMAAWRSGDIFALPFKSALPAAVAPNRSLAAGILLILQVYQADCIFLCFAGNILYFMEK